MTSTKILYVEDDEALGFLTLDSLLMKGYAVDHFKDGATALQAFEEKADYALCLFDVMLPKMDGFTLAEEVRKTNQHIPILFLTAKSMKEDKIKGLRLGADDYITKPYSMEELFLKIEVFLKRNTVSLNKTMEHIFYIGNCRLDYQNLLLHYPEGKPQKLTFKEAELICFFSKRINLITTKEEILQSLWKNDDYFSGRSLDVFISRLRKYFKPDPSIKLQNIYGVGFRLSADLSS